MVGVEERSEVRDVGEVEAVSRRDAGVAVLRAKRALIVCGRIMPRSDKWYGWCRGSFWKKYFR